MRISGWWLQFRSTAYAREPLDKKGMDDSQITGTASSYARKYALNGLFCIDDTKDADTDEYHDGRRSKPRRCEQAAEAACSEA
ncbi:MAG: ERF family protein [Faecalibacterium sp.]